MSITSTQIPALAGLFLFSLSAAVPQTGQAQTPNLLSPTIVSSDATTLPTITVVGSRSAQELPDVLGDVTVLDRVTLDAAAGQSVGEVLRRVAGLEVTDNGGPQTVTRLFMRGSNSNQVLVLVDGLRINAANSGGAAINALALADIERIEILRGAASSLYGADAVGGVINIITRQAGSAPLQASVGLGAGSHGSLQAQAGVSGRSSTWRYAVQASHAQSRGYDATQAENFLHNPDRDSYYQQSGSASLGHTWQPGQDLDLRLFYSRINGGYDAGQPWFSDRSIQELQGVLLSSRNQLHERWSSTLRLGYQRDRLENRNAPATANPDNPPDGVSRFSSRQQQLGWQNDFVLADTHHLTLAVESLTQKVGGDLADYSLWPLPPQYVDYAENQRTTRSVLGIYRGKHERYHWQASLRHDHDSQYGDQTTGGLAVGMDVWTGLRIGLAGSTAFRAPDFNELYYPGGGNPELAPEHSRNLEASVRYQRGDSEYGLTLYRNRVRDMIAGFPSVNIRSAILEGMTFTLTQRWNQTTLQASLDIQNPHDADTGELLPLRAKRIARIQLSHRFGAWEPSLDWYAASARYDQSSGSRERLHGYALLNLGLNYRLNPRTDIQLRWNNVFDRSYTLVSGYATPGSNVFLMLRYQY